MAERSKAERQDVAVVRMEQLYPLRWEQLEAELQRYGDATEVLWVQEEPANMGARQYIRRTFAHPIRLKWLYGEVTRPPSASPATGSAASHKLEQSRLIEAAFRETMPSEGGC